MKILNYGSNLELHQLSKEAREWSIVNYMKLRVLLAYEN